VGCHRGLSVLSDTETLSEDRAASDYDPDDAAVVDDEPEDEIVEISEAEFMRAELDVMETDLECDAE
jgi:hypothetical protein